MGETTHHEELRRAKRVRICCRVHVRQRFAAWTAVTEELSARGCRLVAAQTPRLGCRVELTISSDLLAEDLEVQGEVVWAVGGRVGVQFHRPTHAHVRRGLSAARWVERLIESGRTAGAPDRFVPAVLAPAFGARGAHGAHEVVRLNFPGRRRSG